MSMSQEDFDRLMTQREARNRPTDPEDPMGRFRNSSRSMFVDRKSYTGGPVRGAVSDRRAEWMGGGAGGRMGEDWRNHRMIDVQREGSGLDPISYSIVRGINNKKNKFLGRRADRRGIKMEKEKAISAADIAGTRKRVRDEMDAEAAGGGPWCRLLGAAPWIRR